MTVCDAGIIYKTIKTGELGRLTDQCTSSIAVYEVGNVVWKNSVIGKMYSQKEASEILGICEEVLEGMRIVHSDLNDIYRFAARHHISFYDAAYVCLAADMNVPLVTLDQKLAQKVAPTVKIISFDQFIKL